MQVLGLCPSTSPSTPFPPPSFSSTAPRVRAQQRYSWVQVFSSRFQDRVSFRLSSRRNLWIISTVAGSAAIFFFFFPFLFFLGYVSLSCVRGMRDRAEEVDGGEGVRDAERERAIWRREKEEEGRKASDGDGCSMVLDAAERRRGSEERREWRALGLSRRGRASRINR